MDVYTVIKEMPGYRIIPIKYAPEKETAHIAYSNEVWNFKNPFRKKSIK